MILQPEQAEELLRTRAARAPWAETGFSGALEWQWKQQRAAFLERVDARRAAEEAAG